MSGADYFDSAPPVKPIADLSHLPAAAKEDTGEPPLSQPLFVHLLAKKWHDSDTQESNDRPTAYPTRLRHSDAGSCSRRLSLRTAGFPRDEGSWDMASSWVTSLGETVHGLWQQALEQWTQEVNRQHGLKGDAGMKVISEVKVQVEGLDASGHADMVIEVPCSLRNYMADIGGPEHDDYRGDPCKRKAKTSCTFCYGKKFRRILFELKTKGGFGFKKAVGERGNAEGPALNARWQVSLNALGAECDEVRVGMLAMESISVGMAHKAKINETGRFSGEWRFNREEFEEYGTKEASRMQGILDLLDEEHMLAARKIPSSMPPGAVIVNPKHKAGTRGRWEKQERQVKAGKDCGHDDCPKDGYCQKGETFLAVVDSGDTWECGYCPVQEACTAIGVSGRISIHEARDRVKAKLGHGPWWSETWMEAGDRTAITPATPQATEAAPKSTARFVVPGSVTPAETPPATTEVTPEVTPENGSVDTVTLEVTPEPKGVVTPAETPPAPLPTLNGYAPTDEQAKAIELFGTGEPLVVEAGAGTGKTSTLQFLALSQPERMGSYVAFNRAIVDEAKMKMPGNVMPSTAHSLAMRAVGRKYSHRLNSPRVTSNEIALQLRANPVSVTYGKEQKILQRNKVAGMTMRAIINFCFSADPEPMEEHVAYIDGIDPPDEKGNRTFRNNEIVRRHLLPLMQRAWEDLQNENGQLPFKHDHYLKMWQLNSPRIPGDFVLFDEAQDAAPVMLDAVNQQVARGAQLIFVGDSQQAIYEWRGAVNALGSIEEANRTLLTQSFRFGPAIADVANGVLDLLASDLRLVGFDKIASEVWTDQQHTSPNALLTRTNAKAVLNVLELQKRGVRPHLVGGGGEVLAFARGAEELQATNQTWYADLQCFTSWGQVQEYVANDPQGDELKLLVELMDEYGADKIAAALDPQRMPSEASADIVISTAHKSKGREWDVVKLADDFPSLEDCETGELRLMYVAVTRAKKVLDVSTCEPVHDLIG